MRVVRRGFDEIHEITDKRVGAASREPQRKEAGLPVMLKQLPEAGRRQHRHPPFLGTDRQLLPRRPAATTTWPTPSWRWPDSGHHRRLPRHDPDPLRVSEVWSRRTAPPAATASPSARTAPSPDWSTASAMCLKPRRSSASKPADTPTVNICAAPCATVEKRLRATDRAAWAKPPNVDHTAGPGDTGSTSSESELEDEQQGALEKELGWFLERWATSSSPSPSPTTINARKSENGSGGLFAITINPYTCKGCMLCVEVCDDDALMVDAADPESIDQTASGLGLLAGSAHHPAGVHSHRRPGREDRCPGNHAAGQAQLRSMVCGDGACTGLRRKDRSPPVHRTVTALMQPRVKKHLSQDR